MAAFYYFAFGSNLTPARLYARVGIVPLLGVGYLQNYALGFRKRGSDGSAKCDLVEDQVDRVLEGLVFELPASARSVLDRFEGVGKGYEVVSLPVRLKDESVEVIAYKATLPYVDSGVLPYSWYRDYVYYGGLGAGFSRSWCEAVLAQPCAVDADTARHRRNQQILLISDAQASRMSEAGTST